MLKVSACLLLASMLLTGCLTPLIVAGGAASSVVQHQQIKRINEKLDDDDHLIDYTSVVKRISI